MYLYFWSGAGNIDINLEKFLKIKHNEEFPEEKLLYYIKKIIKYNEIQLKQENPRVYNFMVLNKKTLCVDTNKFQQR